MTADLVRLAAARLGCDVLAFRALLRVECGSDDPARFIGPTGRAIVRVEAHHVLRRCPAATTWGLRVRQGDVVWQGGPEPSLLVVEDNGQPDAQPSSAPSLVRLGWKPWEGHEVEVDGAWWAYHGHQERNASGWPGEYDALDVATSILGPEGAAACSSWGPGQVLGSESRMLGLTTATEVRDLASTAEGGLSLVERWFYARPEAHGALKRKDWRTVARLYNGSGQVETYAAWLAREYAQVGGR